MLSIAGNTVAKPGVQTLLEAKKDDATADQPATATPATETKVAEGVVVKISQAGMQAADESKGANSDIEESGLPDNIQQLLKMIREIKKQIADQLAQMAAIMADKSLTPEQVLEKTGNAQTALGTLQAGLITAETALGKSMKDLSPDLALKAASLAMK
ncbi:hypothetical protein HKK55_16385 [Pseudomonas sp. ADAK18]|jgi:hypothetical protein|uniref:hypothetical protein n=1 Tax=Pseudomonas sp. ADAK18 TaxID=2730848 RepID=UPI001462C8D8|nr:hypothetical protein [Pseudomonas sp. ADAK18]QJI30215.1 hypothetical protein HKK55_16385 [Pseudomonas sp. ADAK18]